jgi:hypothetical protein
MFDCANPIEQTHTLPMLSNFVMTNEEIIRNGMTHSDIFPTSAGMSVVAAPTADGLPAAAPDEHSAASAIPTALPTTRMYSHAEIAMIIQSALETAIPQPLSARFTSLQTATQVLLTAIIIL